MGKLIAIVFIATILLISFIFFDTEEVFTSVNETMREWSDSLKERIYERRGLVTEEVESRVEETEESIMQRFRDQVSSFFKIIPFIGNEGGENN